jgi:hypothetical protein
LLILPSIETNWKFAKGQAMFCISPPKKNSAEEKSETMDVSFIKSTSIKLVSGWNAVTGRPDQVRKSKKKNMRKLAVISWSKSWPTTNKYNTCCFFLSCGWIETKAIERCQGYLIIVCDSVEHMGFANYNSKLVEFKYYQKDYQLTAHLFS